MIMRGFGERSATTWFKRRSSDVDFFFCDTGASIDWINESTGDLFSFPILGEAISLWNLPVVGALVFKAVRGLLNLVATDNSSISLCLMLAVS